MKKLTISLLLVLAVLSALASCKGSSGSDGAAGPGGPAGPSGVEIYSIIANPVVVKPGENSVLKVSAGDGVNSAMTYSWQADAGTLSSPATSNTVTWTAPASVGSYMVSVEVMNAAGLMSKGYASILVSVSPEGPIITSVSPAEVKIGDQIRIVGAGFGSSQGSGSLSIGSAVTTTITSWGDTVIIATVPAGATTGSVVVTKSSVPSNPGSVVLLWTKEDPLNVALSTAANNQVTPRMISDGSGGAIITWLDYRNYNIYAQRINSAGVVQWTTDGVVVCADPIGQWMPIIASDGSGGAIIAWEDYRSGSYYDIYIQRVNSAGVVQWKADGIALTTAGKTQHEYEIISDGSGGAIVVWASYQGGGNLKVYAQRVDNTGASQWTANGVAISAAAGTQEYPHLIPDNNGGAIITWEDARSGTVDVYGQWLNGAGTAQWAANGVAISATPSYNEIDHKMISDGSGGAIVVWSDSRGGTSPDIYVQRVNSAGLLQWTAGGVAVCTAANMQLLPQLVTDGSGGAIITWYDLRNGGGNSDIFAQRVNGAGAVQWMANGVAICTAANNQSPPELVSDDSGGAIITWQDGRNGIDDNIYAQRVNRFGIMQWTSDGVAISTAAGTQLKLQVVPDGSGGAIITWEDYRNGNSDVYAQGISVSGRQ